MDSLTISRINKAHPHIKELLLNQYKEINKRLPKNCRLRFSHVYRSNAEQDALYQQGRTTPGKKVTNAKAGQSIHNYGLAFDIVLLYDKDHNGTFESANWENDINFNKVVEYFTNKGWEWGGNWKFKDTPHFQMAFGFNWKQLKTKVDSGKFIELDSIKYPLL
jgi:peptidoglycan L-alanyl-D-glutamate endopeptidase CwlK